MTVENDKLRGTTYGKPLNYGEGIGTSLHTVDGLTGTTAEKLVQAAQQVNAERVTFPGDSTMQAKRWEGSFRTESEAWVRVVYGNAPLNTVIWNMSVSHRELQSHWVRLAGVWILYQRLGSTPGTPYPMVRVRPAVINFRTMVDADPCYIASEAVKAGTLNSNTLTFPLYASGYPYQASSSSSSSACALFTCRPGTVLFRGFNTFTRIQNGVLIYRINPVYSWCFRGWEYEVPFINPLGVNIPATNDDPIPGTYGNTSEYSTLVLPTSTTT